MKRKELPGKSAAFESMAMVPLSPFAKLSPDSTLAHSTGGADVDVAPRVVERYIGSEVAEQTAYDLEYQSQGWAYRDSNAVYARTRILVNRPPVWAACSMSVDLVTVSNSVHKGNACFLCSLDHKTKFDSAPQKYLESDKKEDRPQRSFWSPMI